MKSCLSNYTAFTFIIVVYCITLFVIPHYLRQKPLNNSGILYAYKNGTVIPESTVEFKNFDSMLNLTCSTWNTWNTNPYSNAKIEILIFMNDHQGLDNNHVGVHSYNILCLCIFVFILAFVFGFIIPDKSVSRFSVVLIMFFLFCAICVNYLAVTTNFGMNDFFGRKSYDIKGNLYVQDGNSTDAVVRIDDQFQMINQLSYIYEFRFGHKNYFTFDRCVQMSALGVGYIFRVIALSIVLILTIIAQAIVCYQTNTDNDILGEYESSEIY